MDTKTARATIGVEVDDLERRKAEIELELAQRKAMFEIVKIMSTRAEDYANVLFVNSRAAVDHILNHYKPHEWGKMITNLKSCRHSRPTWPDA